MVFNIYILGDYIYYVGISLENI